MNAFQPRAGSKVYTSDNRLLTLDQEIGRGGEGSVWSISNTPSAVARFYYRGLAPHQARKLEAMCRLKSESLLRIAAWPTSMLKASLASEPQGLLMPRVNGYQQAHLLYSPKSRRVAFPEAQFPFVLHSTINIARAFAAIHDAGQVIGDVNHGNLLIADNGTVALIDCDSFQIADRGDVFRCLVGVPEFTPPELQAKNFQEVVRTPQHDAFGLAVLVFYMLFLGRHPFMGIYRNGTADITIEQAIGEYRFAYSPDVGTTQMEPPPTAPRLSDFPQTIADLFIRAFTKTGGNVGRPLAHEWVLSLEKASRGLKECLANSSHHYFSHLSACPWCRVEAMVGIPMFGISITVVRDEQFNITSVWARIDAIRPTQKSDTVLTSQMFRGSCSVHVSIADVVNKRTRKRLASVAVISTAVLIVAAAHLEPIVSVAILAAALFGMATLWQQGNAGTKSFRAEYDCSRQEYNAAVDRWNTVHNIPAEFSVAKRHLADAKAALEKLPSVRAQKIAELNARSRQMQLQHFLESHRVEDAALPNIGKARKQLLRVYNIEDASDVEPHRIANIKGFGPTMQMTLLNWRSSVEQRFRFDPTKGIDPRDLRELEQGLQLKRAESIRVLTRGPQQLTETLQRWEAETSEASCKLADSAKRLAQAEVNSGALGNWRGMIEYLGVTTVIALFFGVLFLVWPRSIPVQWPMQEHVGKAGPQRIYPDAVRTPGLTNPDVTQADIGATICNPAWTTRGIRPTESYTRRLKLQQMREWGLPGGPADYEEDHLISLDLAGSPTDPRNLWPEPYGPKPGAREKDVVERYLHAQVCSGRITLEDAQEAIVADWYRIYLLIRGE